MNPAKVSAVSAWHIPETREQLKCFLGFTNFHQRPIKEYSTLAAPFTALTSPKAAFTWSRSADQSFPALKTRFTTDHILQLPDPD